MLAIAAPIRTTAATLRKTTIRTSSASASPKISPRARSSSAALLKSSSTESSRRSRTEPSCPFADGALDDRLHIVAELNEQRRAAAVIRRRSRRPAHPGRPRIRPELHAALEPRVIGVHPGYETITPVGPEALVTRHRRTLQDLLGPLAGEVVIVVSAVPSSPPIAAAEARIASSRD